MSKDYYKILGVNKNSTKEEIKKAFRKKAHQYHPDKKTGNDIKFKEINEAYQILGDKDKKAQYDQFGTTFNNQGGNPFGGGSPFQGGFSGQNVDFDLGDLFGSFFGGGQQQSRGSRGNRGSDIEVDINITLKEAVFGISKDISIRKENSCNSCSGSGAKDNNSYEDCKVCDGSGQVSTTILGSFRTQTICPECRGQGKKIKEKCGACKGQGSILENTDIKIDIPAGIDNGQSIRLSKQGNSGSLGGYAGDLYIVVHVKEEKGFIRDNYDLITEELIPYTIVVLGGSINIKTIDGEVKLKIPSGTASGKKFILKEKGVNYLKSRGRGNQIVIVKVDVPKKLTKKQKELIEELDKEFKNIKKSWF